MKRIDTPSALPGGHFTNGDPDNGVPATQLDASWFENVQEEVAGFIEAQGIALNGSRKDQFREALGRFVVRTGSVIPTGVTMQSSSPSTPAGYCPEDGRLLSTVAAPELYAAIGNVHNNGPVPANTFRVPNSSGRVIVAAGTGPGLTARNVGEIGGEESHTLIESEIPKHRHDDGEFKLLLRNPYPGSLTGNDTSGSGAELPIGPSDGGLMGEAGGDGAHNNMQPYTVRYMYIKVGLNDDITPIPE